MELQQIKAERFSFLGCVVGWVVSTMKW